MLCKGFGYFVQGKASAIRKRGVKKEGDVVACVLLPSQVLFRTIFEMNLTACNWSDISARGLELRISEAFGQGGISQCLAEKIGKVYGSLAFGCLAWIVVALNVVRTGSGYSGEQRLHNRLRREGLTLACDVSPMELPLKVETEDGAEVMEIGSWPILLPHDLLQCFLDAGREDLLLGSKHRQEEYWELMAKDYHDLDVCDPSNTVPLTLYGDECTIWPCTFSRSSVNTAKTP